MINEMVKLHIIYKKGGYHLVNPDPLSRLNDREWHSLLNYLKSFLPHSLDRSLYPNVPVYVYRSTAKDVYDKVEYFCKYHLQKYVCIEIIEPESRDLNSHNNGFLGSHLL